MKNHVPIIVTGHIYPFENCTCVSHSAASSVIFIKIIENTILAPATEKNGNTIIFKIENYVINF